MSDEEKRIQIPESLFLNTYLYFCGDPRDANPERREWIVEGLKAMSEEIYQKLCGPDADQIDVETHRKYLCIINSHKKTYPS